MAIVAAGIVIGYDWPSDLRFKVRLDIYSHTTENSTRPGGVLTTDTFSVEDPEGLVNAAIYTFLADYIVSEWGMTFEPGTDEIVVINPYQKAPASAILSSKCVAFWPMNEEVSGTRVDSVGQNDLIEIGGSVSPDDGKVGAWAARFSEAEPYYLTVTNSADLVSGDFALTVACWVKPTNAIGDGSDEPIFSSRNIAGDRAVFELWRVGATGQLEIRGDVGLKTPNLVMQHGVWSFVVFSYKPSNPPNGDGEITVWLNGVPSSDGCLAPLSDSDRFSFGGAGETSPVTFSGDVDAAGYYLGVLTEEEIGILFDNGAGQEYPFEEPSFAPGLYGTGLVHVVDSQVTMAGLLQDADIADGTISLSRLAVASQGSLIGATGVDGQIETLTISEALDFLAGAADGDIIYRTGGEWVVLPKGTAGQVLTMNAGGTAPEWQ